GCMVNGKIYPFGHIERTEDCFRCTCTRTEMNCCSLFFTPTGYDEENCKIVLNKKTCDYDVVPKNDPSKECFASSRV
ncbi:MSMB protein, partial [Calyptomena viridis]|nr:MSMB protein [Calyptomena viridis]